LLLSATTLEVVLLNASVNHHRFSRFKTKHGCFLLVENSITNGHTLY